MLSSLNVKLSGISICGASFTLVTVTITSSVAVAILSSVAIKVIVSDPVQSGSGDKVTTPLDCSTDTPICVFPLFVNVR